MGVGTEKQHAGRVALTGEDRPPLCPERGLSRERPLGISTCGDGTELMKSTPRASKTYSDTFLVFLKLLRGTEPHSSEIEAPTYGWALFPPWQEEALTECRAPLLSKALEHSFPAQCQGQQHLSA